MVMTSAEAITELTNNAAKYSTLTDLEALVGQVSGEVLDGSGNVSTVQRLLYSGQVNGVEAWKTVNDLVAGAPDKYASISESEIGKFLRSADFKSKLADAAFMQYGPGYEIGTDNFNEPEPRGQVLHQRIHSTKLPPWPDHYA